MVPDPIMPIVSCLLGAYFPKTEAGTMAGAAAMAEAADALIKPRRVK